MKSRNLFYRQLEEGYSIPDDIRDFANFGAVVVSILSNYNDTTNNDIKIKLIMSAIDKYPEVLKEYNKNTGMFS